MSNRLRKPLEEELALARARNKKRHQLENMVKQGWPVHKDARGHLRYALTRFWLGPAEMNAFRVFGSVEVRRPFFPRTPTHVAQLHGNCPFAVVGRWYAITEDVQWAGSRADNAVYMYRDDPLWDSREDLEYAPARTAPIQSARFRGLIESCTPLWDKMRWYIVLSRQR